MAIIRNLILFVLTIFVIIAIVGYLKTKKNNSVSDDFVSVLRVGNNSEVSITATVDLISHKSRLGVIRFKSGKSEGFLPDLSLAQKATVYWSLQEEKAFYHFNKVEFDLRSISTPEDIYKVEFVFNGNDDWHLNLYSKTKPLATLKAKSSKLAIPYKDTNY